MLLERADLRESNTGTTLVVLAVLEGDTSLAHEPRNAYAPTTCLYIALEDSVRSFAVIACLSISSCYPVVSYYMFCLILRKWRIDAYGDY